MAEDGPAEDGPASGALAAAFRNAGLPVPPVPASLRDALRVRDLWLWSTVEVDRMDMYLFTRYPVELLAPDAPDYIAISHGGHGMSSYSINYQLVLGPLAVFVQVAWGGVYEDQNRQAGLMRDRFARSRP